VEGVRRASSCRSTLAPLLLQLTPSSRSQLNSNVGGACGEIVTMKGKFWTGLLKCVLLVASLSLARPS